MAWRGAKARHRTDRQRRPKDRRDSQDAGALKQWQLYRRAQEIEEERRKQDPVAQSVAQHRKRSEKAQAARRKRRAKWSL